MKNINTDIIFFEDINISKTNDELLNIYGFTKDMPEVHVEEYNDSAFVIPQISLILSINATDKGTEKDKNTIDFNKTYRIGIRITETSSGQCIDTIQFNINPCDEELSLCRKIYSKKSIFRMENVVVTKPPKDKNLCVFKVIIQEVVDGVVSEDKWIAQSMHPIKMCIE